MSFSDIFLIDNGPLANSSKLWSILLSDSSKLWPIPLDSEEIVSHRNRQLQNWQFGRLNGSIYNWKTFPNLLRKIFAVQKVENFNKNQVSALDKCVLQKEFSDVIKLFLFRWKIWSSASGLSLQIKTFIGINVLKVFWKLDCEMSIMTDQFCRNMIFLSFHLSSVNLSHFWSVEFIHEELSTN